MRTILACLLLALLTAAVHAEVVMETIDYRHGDAELRGYLFYDDAVEDSRPGVMVIHEWWGNNDYARSRARQLAELGYVAFAADMYGRDMTTEDGAQAEQWAGRFYENPDLLRQRAAAGLDVLASQARTEDQPLAAIGFCFGGTTVLQLACTNPQRLVGVVSFHGSPAPPRENDPRPIQPAILVCHGQADPFVNRDQLHRMIDRFRDHEADITLIEYPDAKHSFTNPGADGSFHEGAIYHEQAAQKSWQDMRDFLSRLFDR